jgi:hypothetical protein
MNRLEPLGSNHLVARDFHLWKAEFQQESHAVIAYAYPRDATGAISLNLEDNMHDNNVLYFI